VAPAIHDRLVLRVKVKACFTIECFKDMPTQMRNQPTDRWIEVSRTIYSLLSIILYDPIAPEGVIDLSTLSACIVHCTVNALQEAGAKDAGAMTALRVPIHARLRIRNLPSCLCAPAAANSSKIRNITEWRGRKFAACW
jgi:hypothetical protein